MNNEFIERMIFEREKDKPFRNIGTFYKYLLKEYKINNIDSDLYKRIMNYQIDTYGHSLNYDDKYELWKSEEDIERIRKNENVRKYNRKRRR